MRASAGLTALEAVAALALVILLLAVAVPNLLRTPELDVRVAARELAADMSLARQLAVSKGATYGTTEEREVKYVVEFRPPGGPYTSYTVREDGEPDEPDFPKALPAGVVASGPPQIVFKRSGAVDDPGPVLEVILSSGSAAARVQVTTATGYVRVVP